MCGTEKPWGNSVFNEDGALNGLDLKCDGLYCREPSFFFGVGRHCRWESMQLIR